jgi:hypothetical protein
MSGVILALLERAATAAPVLAAARRAAQLMRATRINALAIRTPPIDILSPTDGALALPEDGKLRAAETARLADLRHIFNTWAAESAAAAAEWIELEGWAESLVDEWGERADLIVKQRRSGPETDQERRAQQAALFDTGRPVLLVPPDPRPASFGHRVVIAWRDDARTTQAVLAALRWLGEAEIHILVGTRRWEPPPTMPEIFAEHGANATLHILPPSGQRAFGEALLSHAHALNADLLVLGAFAHPMLFGLIPGGVTKHILAHADLPVLMRA